MSSSVRNIFVIFTCLHLTVGQVVYCPSLALYQSRYGVCLMAAGLLVDWDTAENLCVFQGGHLLRIDDRDENDYLIKYINVFGENHEYFYIGCKYTSSKWQWTDGLPVSFDNFNVDEVANENAVGWIYANKTSEDLGKWFAGSGNKNFPFLCEIPPCSQDRYLTADINGTYIRYDSAFEKYYFGNNFITGNYRKAYQECERLSGFLPVIENAAENESLRNIMNELLPDVEQAVIGLSYDSDEWKWVRDNSTYTNWGPGEPTIKDSSAAVVLSLDSGVWHTVPNSNELFLICSAWKSRKLC
ncbi:unnamed protein product [Auanema sp. JU1783]|nr:unnamed protein product [Auanema sp. JU1783]